MNRRSLRSRNSILALRKVLDRALIEPAELSPELRRALQTQSLLAAYRSDDEGIVAMSLNHQKKIANDALGSYEVLDSLRRRVLERAQPMDKSQQRHSSATRASQRERILALEAMVKALSQDLFILQRAFDLRCLQARAYATKAGDAELRQCDTHQRELEASFRLRTLSLPSDKVVPLRGRR